MESTIPIQFTYPNGDIGTLNIQTQIVKLVQEIQNANIYTTQQCLEDPNDPDPHNNNNNINKTAQHVFLQFASSSDYTKFMSILADFDDPNDTEQLEMYNIIYYTKDNFITRFNLHDHNMFVPEHPEDFTADIKNCKYKHPIPKIDINCNLWFKLELLDAVIQKLVLYNKTNKYLSYTEDLLGKNGDPYKN